MRQRDIFDRAADCQRMRDLAPDRQGEISFELVRDFWIALANMAPFMPDDKIAEQVAIIEKIQAAAELGRYRRTG